MNIDEMRAAMLAIIQDDDAKDPRERLSPVALVNEMLRAIRAEAVTTAMVVSRAVLCQIARCDISEAGATTAQIVTAIGLLDLAIEGE